MLFDDFNASEGGSIPFFSYFFLTQTTTILGTVLLTVTEKKICVSPLEYDILQSVYLS